MTIGTRLFTYFNGRLVGSDTDGNRYFEMKRIRPGIRTRRWVLYKDVAEASAVPPEWHAWLHHTTDVPIPMSSRKPWQLPHQQNLTGTAGSYVRRVTTIAAVIARQPRATTSPGRPGAERG